MAEKRKKNRGFVRVLLIIFLLAAAIVAVALAVRSEQEGGLRGFWRELRGETGTDEFFFENASDGGVADLDLGIAVATKSGLYAYDGEGELAWSRLFTWQNPAVSSEGDYGAAFDVGGNLVLFFNADGVILEVTSQEPVVSAAVNDLGYLTVCTQASDYRGIATVYNSLGTAIYRWSSGGDRILSARVSGREELLVVTIGTGGCRLLLLRMDSEAVQAEYKSSKLIIDARFTDAGITALTTEGLIGLTDSLEESWGWDFGGRFLEGYAFARDRAVLGLSDFQVGGVRTVTAVSGGGAELGSVTLEAELTDVDVSQSRTAVLSDGRITVYDTELTETGAYQCDFGAEHVLLRNDGTVMGAGTFSAYVYGDAQE